MTMGRDRLWRVRRPLIDWLALVYMK